jgi:hypothetical protein
MDTDWIEINSNLDPEEPIYGRGSGSLNIFVLCYNHHRPIQIDPTKIWITILSQINLLINYNSEKLRGLYVDFKGKKTLNLMYDDVFFNKALLVNNFVKLIENSLIKENKKYIEWAKPNFSTTTNKCKLISNIMIMGTLKSYFNFTSTCCGVSKIGIMGTIYDWILMKNKIKKLYDFDILHDHEEKFKNLNEDSENIDNILEANEHDLKYNINNWISKLDDFINECINVKRNTINNAYWKNFIIGYHPNGSGDEEFITGHATVFSEFYEYKKTRESKSYLLQVANDTIKVEYITNDICFVDIQNNNGGEPEFYRFEAGILDYIENKNKSLTANADFNIKIIKKNGDVEQINYDEINYDEINYDEINYDEIFKDEVNSNINYDENIDDTEHIIFDKSKFGFWHNKFSTLIKCIHALINYISNILK